MTLCENPLPIVAKLWRKHTVENKLLSAVDPQLPISDRNLFDVI